MYSRASLYTTSPVVQQYFSPASPNTDVNVHNIAASGANLWSAQREYMVRAHRYTLTTPLDILYT